jgi:hypothetical protein
VGIAPRGPLFRATVAGTSVVVGLIPEVKGASTAGTAPSKATTGVEALGLGVSVDAAGLRTLKTIVSP